MVDIKKFRQLDCEIYEEFWPSEVPKWRGGYPCRHRNGSTCLSQ
jgi:hypothetical protein